MLHDLIAVVSFRPTVGIRPHLLGPAELFTGGFITLIAFLFVCPPAPNSRTNKSSNFQEFLFGTKGCSCNHSRISSEINRS